MSVWKQIGCSILCLSLTYKHVHLLCKKCHGKAVSHGAEFRHTTTSNHTQLQDCKLTKKELVRLPLEEKQTYLIK